MNELLVSADGPASVSALLLAALAGAALGAIFFGGLWWTARRGAASSQPALWFFGSLLLRMAIVLPGFIAVAGGQWARMLACLLGFVAARMAVMRLTRPAPAVHAHASGEAGHAP
jgi:F1F0 ATPase subunit 2